MPFLTWQRSPALTRPFCRCRWRAAGHWSRWLRRWRPVTSASIRVRTGRRPTPGWSRFPGSGRGPPDTSGCGRCPTRMCSCPETSAWYGRCGGSRGRCQRRSAGGRGARTRLTICGPLSSWASTARSAAGMKPCRQELLTISLTVSNNAKRGNDVMTSPFLPAGPATPTWYDIVDSPVGRILLTGDERALGGLYLLDAGDRSASVRPEWTRREGLFPTASGQLAEYFAGTRTEFDVPLAPRGTPFQLAVWAELTRIPFGSTLSYGEVAAALGKSPVASRAVGLANGRNPISIIVPCHRVIGADGSLTGYGWGVDRKEWLLRHEGVYAAADLQPTLFG